MSIIAWEDPAGVTTDDIPLGLCWTCKAVAIPHTRTLRCNYCDGQLRPMRRGVFETETIERFFTHVAFGESESDCWTWTASATGGGGPQFRAPRMGKRNMYATRFAYELFRGHVNDSMRIKRDCENRMCVNPEHMTTYAVHSQVVKLDAHQEQMLTTLMEAVGVLQAHQEQLDKRLDKFFDAVRNGNGKH